MISLKDIEQSIEKNGQEFPILKNISLSVAPGEVYGIVTKASSDKKSLIQCLSLLTPPKSGSIKIDNKELTILSNKQMNAARTNIGMVHQDIELLKTRTVYGNIALPLELLGYKAQDIHSRVEPTLALMGLDTIASLYPEDLDLEQKRRVSIARALITRPSILILDQPTATLDNRGIQAILSLLKEINETFQTTLFIFSRDIEVIKVLCDRVAILHKGELHEEGSVHDLFLHPTSSIAREYIKSATRLEMPLSIRRNLLPKMEPEGFPLVRFAFDESSAKEPLFAHLIQSFDIRVNIIQAHQEYIQSKLLSIMLVSVSGLTEQIQACFDYLEENEINFEVLGYVRNTI